MTIRTILPFTIIAALGCAGIITLQAVHKVPTYKNNIPTLNTAYFSEFEFTEYANFGRDRKYSITGKKLSTASKKFGHFRVAAVNITEIKDARQTFYDGKNPVSTIIAKTAVLEESLDKTNSMASIADRIEFSGNVSVVTADRRTLDCGKLRWDKAANRISASGNCVLRYGGNSVRADFIDSDVKLTDFSSRNDKMNKLRALTRMGF